MRTTMIAMLALFVAASAHAQTTPRFARLAPYVVMVSGNVADLWTTKTALETGRAHEGHPAWDHQAIGPLTAVKVSKIAASVVIMRLLEMHGHPKAAKWIGYLDGSFTLLISAHNYTVAH